MTHPTTGKLYFILPRTNAVEPQLFIVMDINTADPVYELDERIEVHLCIILNWHTDKLFNCFSGKFRSSSRKPVAFTRRISRIDAAIPKARNINPHIARNG